MCGVFSSLTSKLNYSYLTEKNKNLLNNLYLDRN